MSATDVHLSNIGVAEKPGSTSDTDPGPTAVRLRQGIAEQDISLNYEPSMEPVQAASYEDMTRPSEEEVSVEQMIADTDAAEPSADILRSNDCALVRGAPVKRRGSIMPIGGVELPRHWFIASWLAIIALHTACGVYLVFAACVNLFLTSSRMVYLVGLAVDKESQYFKSTAVACGVIGAIHLGRVAFIVLISVKEKAFVFGPKPRDAQRLSSRSDSVWRLKQQAVRASVVKLNRRASQVLIRHNLIGENSFAKVFTIQEVVVVFSQTYQAYRCCNLVAQSWINALYVAMVVANCWGIPVLCVLTRNHSPAMVRSVLLSADALFNLGSCFVFPLVIFWPLYLEFNLTTYSFPTSRVYDSVWQSHALMDIQMVFAFSKLDLLSKVVNHLSVLSSLVGATSLLLQQSSSKSSSVETSSSENRSGVGMKQTLKGHKMSRLETFLHLFLVTWAIALLAVYGRARSQMKAPLLGCKSRTHPWFSSGYPCSVFEFNCYQQQTESPTQSGLAVLDPKTLLYLAFTHCPAVRVPTAIQDFPFMMGITLYNSTIVEWSSDSAISATKHKRLGGVAILRSNMSSFPEGIMQPLPASIATVALTYTNLTVLPTDLDERWQSVSIFMVENSDLTALPANIFQMRSVAFSFAGNRIQKLPALDSIQKVIYMVNMSMNPLQALPSSINPYAYIGLLNVEYTNISSVPQWFPTNAGLGVAMGSPYCSLPLANQTTANMICSPMPQTSIGKINMTALDASMPLVAK